ncbi:MAG: hypothetical protein V1728_00945, partial [Candidatus Micrarchaeota archaeon]
MIFQIYQKRRLEKIAAENPVSSAPVPGLPKSVADYQDSFVRLEAENSLLALAPENVQRIKTAMEGLFAKICSEIIQSNPDSASLLPKSVWEADDDSRFQFLVSVIHLGADRRNALGIAYRPGNSTVPQTPNQTMENGFGDCDELCLLLKIAGRALGIRAAEKLVLVAASYSFPANLPASENKSQVPSVGHAFFLLPAGDGAPAQIIDPICLFSPGHDDARVELDFDPSLGQLDSDSEFVRFVSSNKSFSLGVLNFFGIPLDRGGEFAMHYSFSDYPDLLAYYVHQAANDAVLKGDFSTAVSLLRYAGREDYACQGLRALALIKNDPADMRTAMALSDWLMGADAPGPEALYFVSFVYQSTGDLQKSYEAARKAWENRPADKQKHARLLVRLVGSLT